MPTMSEDTSPIKKDIYSLLSVPIPKELLVTYEVDGGKVLTTYPAQYAIDLLNTTLGYCGYEITNEILDKQIIGKAWLVSMQLIIHMMPPHGETFFIGFGSEYATDLDVALKSAKTKAFKHACRFLGIGKELYYNTEEEVKSTQVAIKETPAELSDIIDRISKAETLPLLDELLPEIEKVNGEKLKAMLIKAYNKQKIKLSE